MKKSLLDDGLTERLFAIYFKHRNPKVPVIPLKALGCVYKSWEAVADEARKIVKESNNQWFNRGYVCAVAEIIRTHNEPTTAKDVLRAIGNVDWNDIDEFDRAILRKNRLIAFPIALNTSKEMTVVKKKKGKCK